MAETHGGKKGRLAFTAERLWGFLKLLLKKRKSAFGLAIIIAFVVIAVEAQLFTPYNKLGEDPVERGFPLGVGSTSPTWLRFLPEWLGGKSYLSENMLIVENPGLPKTIEDGGEWNLAIEGDGISYEVRLEEGFFQAPPGFARYKEDGSLQMKISRQSGMLYYNQSKLHLYKEFDYPYTGYPGRFIGNIEVLVDGTTTDGELDIPVNITVYIGHLDGRIWKLWPTPYAYASAYPPVGFALDGEGQPWGINKPKSGLPLAPPLGTNGWIISRSSVDTVASHLDSESPYQVNSETVFGEFSQPHRIVFTSPGRYVYGIEISFIDQRSPEKDAETTVLIDDFGLLLHGTSFGIMGTDHHGRSLFAQFVYGTRVSLYLGLLVSVFSVSIGLSVGLASGYLGRLADELLMRITDILLVLPGLPLLIVLVAVLGASIENLILLLGILGWMGFARMVRSEVLSIKERPFVEAAKAVGAGPFHIILHHILPSVMSLAYISLATSVPGAITAEASLSWLGFYDPFRMSWGRMLNAVFEANAVSNWWWVVPPGLAISLLSAAFILLGYALDEVLNPKLRLRK